MDRNVDPDKDTLTDDVALRKESVDRNIVSAFDVLAISAVALRKESVDRNSTYVARLPRAQVSLSARRAWIEIEVTRNSDTGTYRRSPQGERG